MYFYNGNDIELEVAYKLAKIDSRGSSR